MGPRYRLLALDLDGTLLNPGATLSRANLDAVARARSAGVHVTVCTGRGLVECLPYLRQMEQVDPVIVAGGSITADPVTCRTIDRVSMRPDLVSEVTGILHETGHVALVLKDADAAGYDYLVVTGTDGVKLDPVTEWWFEKMSVRVRFARTLAEDEHPEHTIRVGMCVEAGLSGRTAADVKERLGDRVVMHAFKAVVPREHEAAGGRAVHILEAFDSRAGKWPAVELVAAKLGIDRSEVAAIGDEVNDVGMLRSAGLGIAMGNAVPAAKDVADVVTEANDADGVARAIERILEGVW